MDRSLGAPSDRRESVLSLSGFSVAFGEQVVLRDIDMEVPPVGAFVVLGHGGAGKSTLVRTLAGYNHAQPTLRTWGRARYQGAALTPGNAPTAMTQNARLLVSTVCENLCFGLPGRQKMARLEQRELLRSRLAEFDLQVLAGQFDVSVVDLPLQLQRRITIVRAALSAPPLLMVDEPTADLDDEGRDAVVSLLARESRRRAVLCVTHNRRDAMYLGGTTALLVRGRVLEVTPTAEFFESPRTEAGRRWVETGSCHLTGEEVSTPPPPRPMPSFPLRIGATRGFHWIRHGQLAGMPRPGLLDDLDADLALLRAAGVSVIVSLEEERAITDVKLASYGFEAHWLPIPDMGAPSPAEGVALGRFVRERVAGGRCVAIHCRAGLGRTGTMLAAVLICEGLGALEALEAVRRVQPRFVQSNAQLEFLERLERFVRGDGAAAPSHHTTPPDGDSSER